MNRVKEDIISFLCDTMGIALNDRIVSVVRPSKDNRYDYTVAVPSISKSHTAESICQRFTPTIYIGSCHYNKCFLNFKVSTRNFLAQVLPYAGQLPSVGENKHIIVEYSSPNIAKPFHAGHLRSTIIGNFIANLHKLLGYKVTRLNYLGDWGKQFGLLGVAIEKYGRQDSLYDLYVKINKEAEADSSIHDAARNYFLRMEQGDPKALGAWASIRSQSLERYKGVYSDLGVSFDVYSGESRYRKADLEPIVAAINSTPRKPGTPVFVDFTNAQLGKVIIQKSDGTMPYITRDIAAALARQSKYNPHKMFYVVGEPQTRHFEQLFEILNMMGHGQLASKCRHVSFGKVRGMSSRKGNAILLQDIIEEATKANLEIMKANEAKYSQLSDPLETARQLAISAVFVQDLKAKRIKDYTFDWNRCLSSTGDTGVYLQYAHVRVSSIIRKSGGFNAKAPVDFALLTERVCVQLAVKIAEFPDVVLGCVRTLEPSNIVGFALKLAALVSVAIMKLRVIGVNPALSNARLYLFAKAQVCLATAMRLLWLPCLDTL